eukprot:6524919-Ditylum_brightwellii.AAC.1
MTGCPSSVKFTVRCSYVAIYLEKIVDLLEPNANKTLSVYEDLKGVQIDGASEACCFNETDVIALIHRGKACQSVISTQMNISTNRVRQGRLWSPVGDEMSFSTVESCSLSTSGHCAIAAAC